MFFKRRNKKIKILENVKIINKNYPSKIILAWSKALEGNESLAKFLSENGYEELVFANSAIFLNQDARNWLMKNGYPHIMALIHASEGDEKAQKWLQKHNFTLLYHIALAVEANNDSWLWLRKNAGQEFFILTQAIKTIKDKIEENHNDIHSFRKDF